MAQIKRRLSQKVDTPDLTPMVDCVFLLLIFFMVATTFVEESQLFEVELPRADEADVEEEGVLTIVVTREGRFSVGEEEVDRRSLFRTIRDRHRNEPVRSVIIKGDRAAEYQDIISVISSLQAVDIDGFSLAVHD
ncbi:MAG: biopolymer transporter ExbD [Phycisphaeraceae bacterium]